MPSPNDLTSSNTTVDSETTTQAGNQQSTVSASSSISDVGSIPLTSKADNLASEHGSDTFSPSLTTSSTTSTLNPSLKEDLEALESMNWFQACVTRLRKGKHPNPEIEALLARRLPFRRDQFLGPWPIRYLSTFAWIFSSCTAAWIILWAIGTAIGFTEGVWLASSLMTTAFAALIGLSLSQPIVFLDERALEEAGKAELEKLRSLVGLARDAKATTNTASSSPLRHSSSSTFSEATSNDSASKNASPPSKDTTTTTSTSITTSSINSSSNKG